MLNEDFGSRQIIESLRHGNVPVYGANRFYHCNKRIRKILEEDLSFVKRGGYLTKYFCGPYGAGKSLTLSVVKDKAHEKRFITSFVTLDPRTTVFHKLEIIYQHIFDNLSLKTPQGYVEGGQAVHYILYELGGKLLYGRKPVSKSIVIPQIPNLLELIEAFFKTPKLQPHIISWLMGKRHIPFTVKRQFNVKGEIDRDTCMSFLSGFCKMAKAIGYSGWVLLVDEAESIMELWTGKARDTAYDNIRNLDENRYKMKSFYVVFGGTPEFFSDSEKGIPSFQALNERISHYWSTIRRSYRSPILMLEVLQRREYFGVLRSVMEIYNESYGTKTYISDDLLHKFLTPLLNAKSAPRNVIRKFIAYLDQRSEQLTA